jgi:hypothetical protein
LEKEKFNWKRFGITLFIVILTAAAIGGGVYFMMSQQIVAIEDAKNEREAQLQKELDAIKATVDKEEAKAGNNYDNKDYGFGLTFPESWKGYVVSDSSGDGGTRYFTFGLETSDTAWINATSSTVVPIFTIGAYTKSTWESVKTEIIAPTYLGENAKHIFAYTTGQDAPEDVRSKIDVYKSILKTFKAY